MLTNEYEHSALRKTLHSQIIEGLIQEHASAVSPKPICIFTCGGTASGKTSAVDALIPLLTQDFEPLRLDYDKLKFLIPEYSEMLDRKIKDAANYVQSESVKIGGKVFKKAYKYKYDIIYEKTLDDPKRAKEDIRDLRKKGYEIVVIATHLTLEEGLLRAERRFSEKGRYVPEVKIRECYRKVPASLYELRSYIDRLFLFDNNTNTLQLMLAKDGSKTDIINLDLYERYLKYVGSQFDITKH